MLKHENDCTKEWKIKGHWVYSPIKTLCCNIYIEHLNQINPVNLSWVLDEETDAFKPLWL